MPEGHATFITGLVLGQAPGATVEVRGVLDEDGTADSWQVAHEIVRFGRSGIDVLNLSFLCYSEDGQPPMVLTAAIDRVGPDVVVVAAAGNHGDLSSDPSDPADPATGNQNRKPAWPAALDGVIAVGASHPDGTRADFSPDAPWVDLQAEGVGLRSTYLMRAQTSSSDPTPVEFNGFAEWSGTSFAAALVSGAIAASTDPGRISSRDAARDIIARAGGTAAPTPVLPHLRPVRPTAPLPLSTDTDRATGRPPRQAARNRGDLGGPRRPGGAGRRGAAPGHRQPGPGRGDRPASRAGRAGDRRLGCRQCRPAGHRRGRDAARPAGRRGDAAAGAAIGAARKA